MKCKLFLALMIALLVFVVSSESQSKRNGRVEVIMPLVAPENEHFSPQVRYFTIYANSGKRRFKLENLGHTYESKSERLGYVARYGKDLPPGRYTLTIKGNEDYLLPGFLLEAGRTYTINVPIARLPLAGEICYEGRFFGNRDKEVEGELIRTELFKTGGDFDISVHFCASEQRQNTIVYKSARIYYKDYYMIADVIKIDRETHTVTATGWGLGDPIIIKNGVFADDPGKTFSIKF